MTHQTITCDICDEVIHTWRLTAIQSEYKATTLAGMHACSICDDLLRKALHKAVIKIRKQRRKVKV